MNEINSKILKYNNLAPRYTSYPTAPHFTDKINSDIYKSWLQQINKDQTLSLYFHIPFCRKLCHYCGCHTKVVNFDDPINNYIDLLMLELDLLKQNLNHDNEVIHIHFGGGTPTILEPKIFDKLIAKVRSLFKFSKNIEFAIEVDPRTITEEKVKSYADNGVNRISFGIQDFDLEVQEAINRVQSFELVKNITELFRKYNINNINFDLIYGLPKQNLEVIQRNLEQSISLKPSRIAFFGYAHVPWMKKNMQHINESDLPNHEERLEMFSLAHKFLTNNSYHAIGLDHFTLADDSMLKSLKDGTLKRNFQGYTSDKADILLGLGVSSISYMPNGYLQNQTMISKYGPALQNGDFPITKGIETSEDDRIRKAIIDEIMCYLKVDLNKILKDTDFTLLEFQDSLRKLEPLAQDGLLEVTDSSIQINQNARQITRIVSSIFDKYFTGGLNKHSIVA
jgi:oxygen-independent coproporphyrinogen-3 oxidase